MKKIVFILSMLCPCLLGAQPKDEMTELFNSSTSATTALTTYGKVSGSIDRGIYTYRGIPYAQAKRFEDPQPPHSWTGIRSSRWWGPVCPQPVNDGWKSDEGGFFYRWNDGWQSEDCLRLNIWTKGLHDGHKRPVLVWLHGGAFFSGNGQSHPGYDGHNLCDKGDVVVVSLNHRLNSLGYLDVSSMSPKFRHSGNVGMLDIVAALKWIKQNIAFFGGDADNVTIYGQSGGGAKVSTLMCMPSARGLFHRAMVMSGSGMNGIRKNIGQEIGNRTIEILGITSAEEIQNVEYKKLDKAASQALEKMNMKYSDGNSYSHGFMWGPEIDNEVLSGGIFSDGSEKISNDVPLIIGSTLNEFSGSKIDSLVRPAVIKQASQKIADGGAHVYVYQFRYQLPTMDGKFYSCHNSDIAFFFNNVILSAPMTGATPAGIKLGETMSSYLINFARTGNPNGNNLPHWSPFTVGEHETMILDVPECRIEK